MDPLPHLRTVLASAGYAPEPIAGRLGLDANLIIRRDDLPVHRRRLDTADALDALIRCFLLEAPLDIDVAEALLAPAGVAGLEATGLLRREGTTVRSLLRLTPHAGLLIAHDTHQPGDLREDSVLGLTNSARTLASMAMRNPVGRTLDLGTGCGVQALMAASHSDHVVAVDLNPRALWLTDLNCRLNGITNVECRTGDLFGPVAGETFDLIVTNPPFVISPSREYLFRDSALDEDGLSKAVVTEAAGALAEGGFAHIMCNWVVRNDEPWSAAVESWIDGRGCDALILYYDTLEPLRYAAAWNEDLASDTDRFATTLDTWLDYYRRRGIDAIGLGAVVLRRRTAERNWVKTAELARGHSGAAGEQVGRVFAAQDVRAAATGQFSPLDHRFAAVGHRLQQVLTFRDGAYTAEDAAILLDDGLGLRNRVPPQALHVLLRMDGSRTLGELVAETAEETGLGVESLAPSAVSCVEELFELGFLELCQ